MGGEFLLHSKTMIKNKLLIAAVISTLIVVFVFLLSGRNKYLIIAENRYGIERFDEGDVYYFVDLKNEQQGGLFEGIIHSIYWDTKYVISNVTKQYRGDLDGVYVFELSSHNVTGPYNDDALFKKTGCSFANLKQVSNVFNNR
jgi:AAA+ ATPase superfamily predicted ATPase